MAIWTPKANGKVLKKTLLCLPVAANFSNSVRHEQKNMKFELVAKSNMTQFSFLIHWKEILHVWNI